MNTVALISVFITRHQFTLLDHRSVCMLFTSRLSLVDIAPTQEGMARLS